LTVNGGDRIRDLLSEGWQLLEAGRSREAADAFGRVLLQDAGHEEARRGLDTSRAAAAEQARLLDVRMDEACRALDAGDRPRARTLLEEVVRLGGDRDRALSLLDRMEDREGRLGGSEAVGESSGGVAPAALPGAAREWSRRAFAAGWAVVLASLLAIAALSWDSWVAGLVRTPSPQSRAAAPSQNAAASGQVDGGEAAP
jgi:hypothetical protein